MSNSQHKKKQFLQMVQLHEQGRAKGGMGEGPLCGGKMQLSLPEGPTIFANFSLFVEW